MRWRYHGNLSGTHSLLSPSSPAWLNYDESKLTEFYRRYRAKVRGTLMHGLAKTCIDNGIPLGDVNSNDQGIRTLGMYVTDCRDYNMDTEVMLYYSSNAYGTCDAIRFDEDTRRLMIFDLKTGITVASFRQLEIYAAYFCLEYNVDPKTIDIELRIYQTGDIRFAYPTPEQIERIMDIVIRFDDLVNQIKKGGGL